MPAWTENAFRSCSLLPLAAQLAVRYVVLWQVHGDIPRGQPRVQGKEGCVCGRSVREFQLINLQFLQWKFTAVKRFNMLIKSAFCRRRWFINSSFVYECVLYLRHSLSSLSTRIILTHSLTAQFSSNTNTNSQRINVACRIESASASWLVCCLPPNLVCFFGTVILLSNMSHNDLY